MCIRITLKREQIFPLARPNYVFAHALLNAAVPSPNSYREIRVHCFIMSKNAPKRPSNHF